MAAKRSPLRPASKARREGSAEAAQQTTSQEPAVAPAQEAVRETTKTSGKRTRGRGRPRVSNTDTTRITLRVESDHMQVIDTLVRLRQYSNRSDAIRQAIKEFTEKELDSVETMVEKQKQRQKLMRLAALADQLDEMSAE